MKAANKKMLGTALKVLVLLFVYDKFAAPMADKALSKLKKGGSNV